MAEDQQAVSPIVAIVGTMIGGTLTLFGFVWMWSPIPFGIVFMAIGLTILIGVNPLVRRWVRRLRVKHKKIDDTLDAVQERAPGPIRAALERTDPDPPGRDAGEAGEAGEADGHASSNDPRKE